MSMDQKNEKLFDESTYFTTWATVMGYTRNTKVPLSNNSLR